MKEIRLCDNAMAHHVKELCDKYRVGIEIQTYFGAEYLRVNPRALLEREELISGIGKRSLHSPVTGMRFENTDAASEKEVIGRIDELCGCADQLNCSDIILHRGYPPDTSDRVRFLSDGARFWNHVLQGRDKTPVFHFENLYESDPQLFSDYLSAVGHPGMDACLDIGHAHCHSGVPILDWIRILNTKIGYVHLHNKFGRTDEHLGLREGTIPVREVCEALEQYAPGAIWALETQIEFLEDSIYWLQEHSYWKSGGE